MFNIIFKQYGSNNLDVSNVTLTINGFAEVLSMLWADVNIVH